MNEPARDKYEQVEQLLLEIRAGVPSVEDAELLNVLLLSDEGLLQIEFLSGATVVLERREEGNTVRRH